tara:strand:- start:74 stop:391 length:318 start_codon:yes stop_codon:yes gene_type:complete
MFASGRWFTDGRPDVENGGDAADLKRSSDPAVSLYGSVSPGVVMRSHDSDGRFVDRRERVGWVFLSLGPSPPNADLGRPYRCDGIAACRCRVRYRDENARQPEPL